MVDTTEVTQELYHVPDSRVVHADKDCGHLSNAETVQQVHGSSRRPCHNCMIARDHEYVEEFYDRQSPTMFNA